RAISQIDQAIKNVPTTRAEIGHAANQSTGLKHDVLVGIQHRLRRLPHASEFIKPALDLTVRAFEAIVAVFFVLPAAAYWIVARVSAVSVAIGVGLTQSWGVAIAAGIVVLIQRQLEDYLIAPRVLGGAVGLSPLLVMTAVITSGILFGALAVVLAIPAVAVLTTLVDVTVRNVDPAEQDVPTVLFPAREADR